MEILFSDFETLTADSKDFKRLGHTEIVYWAVMDESGTIVGEGRGSYSFLKWMVNRKSFVMYFHNLAFDGYFIECLLFRNKWTFYNHLTDPPNDYYRFTSLKSNNKIYKITANRGKKAVYKFLCTKLLFSTSIANMGKILNLPKIDWYIEKVGYNEFLNRGNIAGYDDPEFEKYYRDYCIRDIDIMRLTYLNFIKTLRSSGLLNYEYNGKPAELKLTEIITIGQLVKKIWEQFLFKDELLEKKNLLIDYKNYRYYKQWVHGGLTQFNINTQGVINKDIIVLDIVSSYPSSMTQELPFGDLLDIPPQWDYYTYLEIHIIYGTIKPEWDHIPCIKNSSKNDYRYHGRENPIYASVHYYLEEEWNIIKNFYNLVIEKIIPKYCKVEKFMKSCSEELFKLKQQATFDKKESDKFTYKVAINALYGKTLQDIDIYEQWFDNDANIEKFINENTEYLYITKRGKEKTYKIHNYVSDTGAIGNKLSHLKMIHKKDDTYKVPNPLVGATILALSRIKLLKQIVKIPKEYFLYCATDSVFFKAFDNWENILKLGDNLGDWNLEGKADEGIFYGANKYLLKGKDYNKIGLGGITRNNNTREILESIIDLDTNIIEIDDALFKKHYDNYGIYFTKEKKVINMKGQN